MNRLSTLWRLYAPECVVVGLAALAFLVSALREPRFLDAAYLLNRSTVSTETALLGLAMTLVIVAGHIDLSCTAILALVGAVIASLHDRFGVPLPLLLPLAPVLGGLLGAVNGWLVARRGLPSLVVTIGTMALYRGAAQILLGDHSLALPAWFVGFDRWTLPRTYIPAPLLMVLVLASGFALVRHRTLAGRWITAIGLSPDAARYTGIPVERTVLRLFVVSGATAGLCALTLLSRLGVARFDHARGLELDAITAVVLGGTSIFGGRGTIFGTLAAVMLIGVVQTGMGIAQVKAEVQIAAIGVLLLSAVGLSRLTVRRP